MRLIHWLRSLKSLIPAGPRQASRPANRFRPRLEALEDRCLMSAGALDPTFGSGGTVITALNKYSDQAYGTLLQPNGNIIAYGDALTSTNKGDVDNFGLTRYTPAGKLDTTFGSGGVVITGFGKYPGGDFVESAALQADGKIVAVGKYKHLIRYNSNGSLDTTFGSGGVVTYPSNWAYTSMARLIQPSNGDIVVGGEMNGSDGYLAGALLRYTPAGTLDTTFGTGGELVVPGPGIQGSARIITSLALENGDLVAGGFDNLPFQLQQNPWVLLRYTLSGSLDTTFGSGGVVTTLVGVGNNGNSIQSLLVQPDGRIVAVGNANNPANATLSQTFWALARYNVDGSLDSSFGTGGVTTSSITGNDRAHGSALQSNGQIVVTGGGSNLEVGVYNPNGSPDASFGTGGFVIQAVGSSSLGQGVVIQTDGKIVAVGRAVVNGKQDFLLARFLPSAAQIGSFTASPNPAPAGSNVTLTASNITLADPNSSIAQVAFYLDSNHDGTLEPGTDTLLGYATQTSPGVWTLNFSTSAFGLTAGSYTLFARAQDSDGVFGDPFALTLTVQ